MTECQNDLKPKEKDGLETAEIVRLVPLEGSEVGHTGCLILKCAKVNGSEV